MKLDILAFAAHPDDVELSCSGTLMKHIAAGKKVGIIDITRGELGSRGSHKTRSEEAVLASEILGIHVRKNLEMADGFFEVNEVNKRLIIEQIRRYQPTIVLANAIEDRHPDHGRASKLVSDACFLSGLSRVETIYEGQIQEAHRPKAVYHYIQDRYIKPDFVVDVTGYQDRIFESIKAYKTQFYDPDSTEPQTPISGEEFFDFIKGRMLQFGRPIGALYAEGFTVERTAGVNDLFDLI
ncbi:MAG: bacillithiol biosynthesis deacetylase BshB1 [Flavobacteriia bacterium]|jgi:bacillithiol biosynthesis deacetylase BshB1